MAKQNPKPGADQQTPKAPKEPKAPKAPKATNKVWAVNLYNKKFGRVNEGDPVTDLQLSIIGGDSNYIKTPAKSEA